jgi:hypothetical protein
VYLQNRSPHRILEDKTPEESFIGKRPEIGHLMIFCCPVYIHIPVEKRTKLQPSGERGILVRYSEDSKAPGLQNLPDRAAEDSGEPRCQVRGELGI